VNIASKYAASEHWQITNVLMSKLLFFKYWLVTLTCATLLSTACSKESANLALQISGYNHTNSDVGSLTITTQGGERGSSGYVGPGTGGGGFSCCMSMPRVWQPNMTVTVEWESWKTGVEKTLSQVVKVPQYDSKTASTINVHFLRSGEVKVFVSRYGLRNRNYPLKGKEAELKPGVPIELVE
jgi:Protein of unknown function (DUF3304)